MEIWKDIKGYEGVYQVSNLGRVRSLSRELTYSDGRKYQYKGKVLKVNVNKVCGARMVHLYLNQSREALLLHRLVAVAFIPNPSNKPEINHINGDRSDNSVSNLEWATRAENMEHGFRTGLINNTGTNHGNNVYPDEQIREVKRLLKEGSLTQKAIAEVTGVKKGTVEQIAQGRQWRHI